MIEEKDTTQQESTNDGVNMLSQENEQPAQQEQQDQQQQEAQEQGADTENERNFRRLREEKEKIQKERDEMLKWMQQVTTAPRQQQPQQQQEEPRPNYNPDDLVEWKVVDQELNRMRNEFNRYKQQSTEQMVETQLRSRYHDFDSVVSKDNIEMLRQKFPEVANTISSSSDLYNKAASAYTLIKQFGIHKEADYAPQRERAQQNVQKPKSASLVSPSTGSEALGTAASNDRKVTPDLKKRLQEEMMAASKKGYFR